MGKLIIGFIFYLISASALMGQTTTTHISGTVKNASGKSVGDVNVYISRTDQKYSVFASCLSEEDGTFSLSFSAPTDSVCINVSGLNINPKTVICANKTQHQEITVEEKTQEIAEVIVKAPKIYSHGDTISYNVASFQSKNDISIAQVLKKLPGITVSDVGQISYKGQPIKNFYIEGLDLMKGRYGIATNNLDPNNISTIQILENHQDIKALKDLRPEERASINLKLKNGVKGVFNLIATLGGGYDDEVLWNNELLATYFRKNSQLLATYKGNNTGNDLETELRSFDDYDYSRTSTVSDISLPGVPDIAKKYYYFNRSHSATYNHVFRIDKTGEFGVNVAFLNDRDERSNQSLTTTLLPDGRKHIVNENFTGMLRRNMVNGNVTYTQNADRNYIKEQLRIDFLSSEGESNILAGENITQNNQIKNYRLNNHFHRTNRTASDKGIDFLSRINFEKRPHSLFVAQNLFPDIISAGNMYQIAERRNLALENRLDFLSAIVWGNLQIHPTIFFDYSDNGLTSGLGKHKNDLQLVFINTGVGVIANYKLKRFYADLYLAGNYKYFYLTNRDTDISADRHRFLAEPRLTLKYDIEGTNELCFVGSASYSNPAIENLYDQYILTSYRKMSVYDNHELFQSRVQNFTLSYNYRNIVSMLFMGADFNWTHNRPTVLYGCCYDGIVEKIISRHTDEVADVLSLKGRFSKGFDWKRMKISAECKYSHYDSPILLQNEIIRYHGNTINARLDWNFNPFDGVSFSYGGTYFRSHTGMKGGVEMPLLETLTNNASISFNLPNNFDIEFGATHYYNNWNKENPSFLLGETSLKYSYRIFSFTLSCDNIFNKRNYVYSLSDGLTESTAIYRVRSRSVLLKIRCRIL